MGEVNHTCPPRVANGVGYRIKTGGSVEIVPLRDYYSELLAARAYEIIKRELNPQEVYFWAYNDNQRSDEAAIALVCRIYGRPVAKTITRLNARCSLDDVADAVRHMKRAARWRKYGE